MIIIDSRPSNDVQIYEERDFRLLQSPNNELVSMTFPDFGSSSGGRTNKTKRYYNRLPMCVHSH